MSIYEIPDEMILTIYAKLMPRDKIAFALTCVRFYTIQPGFIRWFMRNMLVTRDVSAIEYRSVSATMSSRRNAIGVTMYTLEANRKYHNILTSRNKRVPLHLEEKIGDPPAGEYPYVAAYVDIECCAVTNLQLACSISHGLV